ncbi:hypothetical protein DRE_06982 [Drechslerella stenobrocha 248]|uniref:UDP-N-acetylglucosamine transferase subunit ALG13 n=1 Tax=Drechslerella stenobrocha 248 TaxID=1043628 RepID=W7HVS3_9PEZI|nr:hypothetical protein DRE_06982 [Drechslerella stenobrocha 248]
MASGTPERASDRKVLVTVGTTAFDGLIEAVVRPSVVDLLRSQGYTSIRVQYGTDIDLYKSLCNADLETALAKSDMSISGFAYADGQTITNEIKSAELVISHAGSGTILECLRYQKRIIVVPNQSLMENHQVELANEMAKLEYVINSSLADLTSAIELSTNFQYKHFPRTGRKVFTEIVEEELVKADKDRIY